ASRTNAAAYSILCWDQVEADRREKLPEEERSKEPPIKVEDPKTFTGNCDEEGESSVFFLFNIVPVTPPINPEYAIGSAVQRLEGDTMINIRTWHETHYYSILGRVSVFKVKGRIIKFQSIGTTESDKNKPGTK